MRLMEPADVLRPADLAQGEPAVELRLHREDQLDVVQGIPAGDVLRRDAVLEFQVTIRSFPEHAGSAWSGHRLGHRWPPFGKTSRP